MRETLRRGAEALMAVLRAAAGAMLIASVGINFANIIGRYFFSVSLSWAEEAMLFLMIGCVFLGAGPVGWSGRHIRMDVIISLLPAAVRAAIFELFSDLVTIATCVALAIFAWPVMTMLAELDQRSETANIPMVIPQSVAAARASADGAADRDPAHRASACATTTLFRAAAPSTEMAAAFVYFILPAILLILGLPIFVVLILTSLTAILFVAHVPTAGDPDLHVRQPRQFPAARRAVLRAGRRDHGPRRHRQPRRHLGRIHHWRRARLARRDHGGFVGTVRRDGAHLRRHRGRDRQAAVSLAHQTWLYASVSRWR